MSVNQILLLLFLKVLLPVQRRAAGDPVADQRPPVCAAPPEEVL